MNGVIRTRGKSQYSLRQLVVELKQARNRIHDRVLLYLQMMVTLLGALEPSRYVV